LSGGWAGLSRHCDRRLRARGVEAWKDEVAKLWPQAGLLIAGIDTPDRMTPAFYAHFTARRPAGPRTVSIGDAAHCTSPQLGQGAARDAVLPAMNLVPYFRREAVRTMAGLKTGLFTSLDPAALLED
jgi:2-polyprenyl-6-methoxyphenol hydroxylase-like FAD-dependent oxidoreductase